MAFVFKEVIYRENSHAVKLRIAQTSGKAVGTLTNYAIKEVQSSKRHGAEEINEEISRTSQKIYCPKLRQAAFPAIGSENN